VTNTGGLSEGLSAYREMLVAADQKGQDEFDMAVLSLSGGGLAVSLAFLSDVIGDKPVLYPAALALAWGCWGFSALAVLGSYWMSNKTIRGMINEIDVTRAAPKEQRYAALTSRLNGAGAVLFVLGVLFITVFAWVNLVNRGEENGNASATATAATSSPASIAGSGGSGQKGVGSAAPASAASAQAVTRPTSAAK
jgi:hypothetical protein